MKQRRLASQADLHTLVMVMKEYQDGSCTLATLQACQESTLLWLRLPRERGSHGHFPLEENTKVAQAELSRTHQPLPTGYIAVGASGYTAVRRYSTGYRLPTKRPDTAYGHGR
jgi:hypothetical protein